MNQARGRILRNGRCPRADLGAHARAARRVAAIDVGTNSVHMIVVRVRPDLSFEVIDREKEMVRLGAYRPGADAEVDEAVRRFPLLDQFLEQAPDETTEFEAEFLRLAEILS